MKGMLMILHYFFNWQFLVRWSSIAGLLLLIPAVGLTAISRINPDLSMLLSGSSFNPIEILPLSYVCLLIIPLISAPIAFRFLISNRQLALLPSFHLKAGVALLLLTLLSSFFFFFYNLFIEGIPSESSPLLHFSFNFFCLCSILIMFFQIALPSKHFVYLISFGLIFIVFLIYLFENFFFILVSTPHYIYLSTFICTLGWIIALKVLATKNSFKPASTVSINQTVFSYGDMSWFSKLNFGTLHSAAGTLLCGSPDGFTNKIKSTLDITVFSPFISALFLLLIGFGEDWPIDNEPLFPIIFLSLSFVLCSLSVFSYGNLSARSRLLWLRHGGNRTWLWFHLERTLFSNLLLLFLLPLLVCMLIFLFSSFSPKFLFHYLFSLVSYTLFVSYFSLTAKIYNLPITLLTLIFIFVFCGLMTISFTTLIADETLPKLLIDFTLLLGSFCLRFISKNAFVKIDWAVIKPVNHRTTSI